MKNILTLSTVFSVLFLISCQKEELVETCTNDCTTVTGRLVTANAQHAISGATVTVKWHYPAGFGYKSNVKSRSLTDANGYYSLSFHIQDEELRDGYFDVSYEVDKNNYYTIGEDAIAFNPSKRDTIVQVKDYSIPRKAYVQLAIPNQSQLIAGGESFMSDFNSCYGLNTVFSRNISGGGAVVFWNSLPAQNPLPVPGDQPILVRNFKTKNGVKTITSDSIFIAAGTTQSYTVTY